MPLTAPATQADLSWGATWPTLEGFTELALAGDRRVIPVVRRLLADAETPVGAYRKLARDEPGTFLLESAEHGGVWSRWSIVGAWSVRSVTGVRRSRLRAAARDVAAACRYPSRR